MQPKGLELSYAQFLENGRSIAKTILDEYIISESIDEGAIGEVFKGYDQKNGRKVAVKFVNIRKISRQHKKYLRLAIRNQANLLSTLKSEHIIKCYDFYENEDFAILITEYCNGTTLSELIEKHKNNPIPEDEIIDILKQILTGVATMHSQRIIHRDIKSDNIMFHNGVIKLLDLGFSKAIRSKDLAYHTILGTVTNMAPEVIEGERYGLKADIWSLGIVLYQLIYGFTPYEPGTTNNLMNQIKNKDIFPNNGNIRGRKPSKQLLKLLKSMLQTNQHARISWEQLLTSDILCNQKFLPKEYRLMVSVTYLKQCLSLIQDIQSQQQSHEEQNTKMIEASYQQYNNLPQIIEPHLSYSISQLQPEHQLILNQPLDIQQNNFQIIKEYFLDCKKTEFILNNLIFPLESDPLILNLETRKNAELMYLLISRCYCNLSFLKNDIESLDYYTAQKLKERVRVMEEQVNTRFQKYGHKLTQIQDRFGSMISDRFLKMFNKKVMDNRNKYLVGVEKTFSPTIKKNVSLISGMKSEVNVYRKACSQIYSVLEHSCLTQPQVSISSTNNQQEPETGFSREQQIKFTTTNYINYILPSLDKQKRPIIYNSFLNYAQINLITTKELEQIDFDYYLDKKLRQKIIV